MITLSIDTALDACTVGLVEIDAGEARTIAEAREIMTRGHADRIVPMIDDVLAEADLTPWQIDMFAATVGPGSFTGVRVGISAIRALALATGRPAIGVGTLAAIAWPAVIAHGGPVISAIEARRGDLYAQPFQQGGEPKAEAQVAPAQTLAAQWPEIDAVAGSGATALAAVAASTAGRLLGVIAVPSTPTVEAIAFLAAARPKDFEPIPLYLRPPDAKPQTGKSVARR